MGTWVSPPDFLGQNEFPCPRNTILFLKQSSLLSQGMNEPPPPPHLLTYLIPPLTTGMQRYHVLNLWIIYSTSIRLVHEVAPEFKDVCDS